MEPRGRFRRDMKHRQKRGTAWDEPHRVFMRDPAQRPIVVREIGKR